MKKTSEQRERLRKYNREYMRARRADRVLNARLKFNLLDGQPIRSNML